MAGTYGPVTLFQESVSTVTATNSVALGTRRQYQGIDYVYAYNGGSTIPLGVGVVLSGFSAGTIVAATAAISVDKVFGVVQNTALTASYYGWVAVRGFMRILSNGITTRYPLQSSVDSLGFEDAAASGIASGLAGVCGQAVNTLASGASGIAYIKGIGA